MATGSLNANGIWIYGEDDPASPASDLLNLGQTATSNALGDLKARVVTLETAPVWSTFNLDANYALTAGYNKRVLKQGAVVVVEGTRLVRTGTALTVAQQTDYTFVSGSNALAAGFRPAVMQEFSSSIYLGSGVNVPITVKVGADGTMAFRSYAAGTLSTAAANVLVLPPMTWAVAA